MSSRSKHGVCPWWIGYLLASPLWRLQCNPAKLLAPYIRDGMAVLEPGPGMGFFTLELARRVGAAGRVIAVDIPPRMIQGLKRRAAKAGLLDRIDARLAPSDGLGLGGLEHRIDFVFAFAVVHEMTDARSFFAETVSALKAGGALLLAEPAGHVDAAEFEGELAAASAAGLIVTDRPAIRGSLAALLRRPDAEQARSGTESAGSHSG